MNCLLMLLDMAQNLAWTPTSFSALLETSALGVAPKAQGHLARGMSERPRTRWERIQSPTLAVCRAQSGVKCQHFSVRDSQAHTFFSQAWSHVHFSFFHLFENLELQRKGLCAGVFHFQMFLHRSFCLPPTFQSPEVSFIRKKFSFKI